MPIAMPALRSAPRRRRRRAIVGVSALVLGLHLLLLTAWQDGAGEPATSPPQALQVRQIVVAAPAVAARATARGSAAANPRPSASPVPAARVARKDLAARVPKAQVAPARPPVAAVPPAVGTGNAVVDSVAAAALATGDPAAADEPADDGTAADAAARPDTQPLPVYATRMPPAATLVYALRRGTIRGHAELRWQPGDGRYSLSLDGGGDGLARLGSTSTGRFDGRGVAPERHVESRRGRALRSVNFRHEAGRISFSGPSFQLPLQPGSQDRLSWMVQLAAVLAAEPALRTPGSEVRLHVVGTRGDAQVWVFAVQGPAEVETADGVLTPALRLHRAASRPYDTEVEVWLDPARHHLPVRLRQRLLPGGPETELTLAAYEGP